MACPRGDSSQAAMGPGDARIRSVTTPGDVAPRNRQPRGDRFPLRPSGSGSICPVTGLPMPDVATRPPSPFGRGMGEGNNSPSPRPLSLWERGDFERRLEQAIWTTIRSRVGPARFDQTDPLPAIPATCARPVRVLWIEIGVGGQPLERGQRLWRRVDAPVLLLVDVEPDQSLDEWVRRLQREHDTVDPRGLVTAGRRR
jgi:hypothetical protein